MIYILLQTKLKMSCFSSTLYELYTETLQTRILLFPFLLHVYCCFVGYTERITDDLPDVHLNVIRWKRMMSGIGTNTL
jgi:hypothetical protein